MAVFDSATLILAIDPKARGPIDPNTGKPVENCQKRVQFLLASLNKSKTPIIIPTPVLAEYLVRAGPERHQMLERFRDSKNFDLAPFDIRAAVECAELLGDPDLKKKKLDQKTTWAKIKFDRQIIAIAKSRGDSPIYTDDKNLADLARENHIAAVLTWELPEPPEDKQIKLFGNGEETDAAQS